MDSLNSDLENFLLWEKNGLKMKLWFFKKRVFLKEWLQ
jgi:hypothetical protein